MISRPAAYVGFALLLCLVLAIVIALRSPSGQSSGEPPTPLATMPTLVLGRLDPGEKAEARLSLTNRSRAGIRLDRVESSCPCVQVASLPASVDSGGRIELRVSFDPAEEPDFRGRLTVGLTGLGGSGEVLFRSTVDVTVAEATPVRARPSEPSPRASGNSAVSSRSDVEVAP